MNTTMKIKTRSSTGCWTCRLRRKKCDEQQPVCNRCKSLQLPCDGYAERPQWMDGGDLERRKAEETKVAIRRNRRASNRNTSFDRFTVDLVLAESCSMTSPPGSRDGAQRSSSLFPPTTPTSTCERIHHIQDEELPIASSSHSSASSSHFPLNNTEPNSVASWQEPNGWTISAPFSARSNKLAAAHISTCYDWPGRDVQSGPVVESELLLHYFDNIHGLQFPFSLRGNRGWLYSMIVRSKLCYWSTLALSAYSMDSSFSYYYNMAILEMRKCLCLLEIEVEARRDMTIDCCFSIIQLMLLEIQRDETESCRMHLSAASNLLSGMHILGTDFMAVTDSLHAAQIGLDADRVNQTALRFITIMMHWLDIIYTCSTRSDSSCPDLLRGMLHDGKVELAELIACQSAVAASIARISELDSWRRQAGKAGRVSIVELVRRGTDIERTLQENLRAADAQTGINLSTSHTLTQTLTSGPVCAPTAEDAVIYHISGIFASAASVYLHVIISGAQADVPEIRDGVQETMKRLRCLPDPYLLRYLAWPFCVIGCLAPVVDRPLFLQLADAATSDQRRCGTVPSVDKGLSVMRECWRLRDEGIFPEAGWTDAMETLGIQSILL